VPKKSSKLPLSKTHPKLANEAVGWDPTTVKSGASKKLLWRCPVGHHFEASVSNRSKGRNCPFCSNRKLLTGFNDLATLFPELASEAFGWDPKAVFGGSGL
jgi:hypothetical protein